MDSNFDLALLQSEIEKAMGEDAQPPIVQDSERDSLDDEEFPISEGEESDASS